MGKCGESDTSDFFTPGRPAFAYGINDEPFNFLIYEQPAGRGGAITCYGGAAKKEDKCAKKKLPARRTREEVSSDSSSSSSTTPIVVKRSTTRAPKPKAKEPRSAGRPTNFSIGLAEPSLPVRRALPMSASAPTSPFTETFFERQMQVQRDLIREATERHLAIIEKMAHENATVATDVRKDYHSLVVRAGDQQFMTGLRTQTTLDAVAGGTGMLLLLKHFL